MLKRNTCLTSLSVLLCFWSTQAAIADSPMTLVRFNPPPDNPQPDKTTLGGRRSGKNCDGIQAPQAMLMALVPNNQKGLTAEQYPDFWAYIPETSAQQVVLSIKEQVNGVYQYHSQRFFSIPSQSGLVRFQMSDQQAPLEVGKTYSWAISLVCKNTPHPSDPVIEGLVSRINMPITKNQQSPLERAAWYGEKGVWYDTVKYFAEARQASPSNPMLLNNWTTFLKSVGLESVVAAPLLF